MRKNTLEKLYTELTNANYSPSYSTDGYTILVMTDDGYDWEISESAKAEHFGVTKDNGFSESESYICEGITEVMNLLQ